MRKATPVPYGDTLGDPPGLGWTARPARRPVQARRVDRASRRSRMRKDHPSTAVRPSSPVRRTYSIVSTYPPTPCGVATFSAALSGGLQEGGAAVEIVRLGDDQVDPRSADAARRLGDADVVIVQHEYGIYDGPDGDAVIELLERLVRPSILVAHTVLRSPTTHQRTVLEAAAHAADAVVVMTEAGRERLGEGYRVDQRK